METKMQIKKLLILSFLILTFFTGCGEKEGVDENMIAESKSSAQKMPQFHLKSVDGKDITITVTKNGWQFKGIENKVVLLNFFGTWCPPCKAEIPHLLNIRKKLEKDFEILAVDIGKRGGGLNTIEELQNFIKEYEITYPITTGGEVGQLFGAVSELNPSGSIPFMILFNKKGQYLRYYVGMKPEEMLFNDISQAIKM
jgi:thiol-disulfide isomerase/thioredoxin